MKKIAKGLLRIIILIVVLIGIGLTYVYTTSYSLGKWEYTSNEGQSKNLPQRPNILLLVAEDMSLRVGAFGDSVAETPNIDKLASEGIRYPNVFTTAGVCSPSRAALITGMSQISIGGQHMRSSSRPKGGYMSVPPAKVKAFPELLRGAGYYTFNTLKEDYQFSGMGTGSGPFTIWDAYDDSKLWRSRKGSQPFFGMMNFMETHETGLFTPLGNKPNSIMHFIIQLIRPAMVMSTDGKQVDPDKIEVPPYYPDTKIVRADMARLYSNINAMDGVVGDVLDRLEKDGLASSTIVIWTTDHGDCLPRAKRDLYDSGIKVPMIIRWPEAYRPKDVQPGTLDERLISFVDIAPTLLNLAKAPKPAYLQGKDFVLDTIPREYIYASRDRIDEIDDRQRAVRDNRFKYIRSWSPEQTEGSHLAFRDNLEIMKELWFLKKEDKLNSNQLKWFETPGKERLFDIQNDPYELHNLSKDTTYTVVLNRMRTEMDNWLKSIEDWSEVSEDEMVEKFLPNGEQEKTATPKISKENNHIIITTTTKNASLGYRINKKPWQLYTKPFSVPANVKVTAKSVRYGWKESDEVRIE